MVNHSSKQLRAIVTGASSGIGKATALAFARSGIEVALIARSRDKLTAVADEIQQQTEVKAGVYPLDFGDCRASQSGNC